MTGRTDCLGNEYHVGDTVAFASSGSLYKGVVEKFNSDGSVSIRPTAGSGWMSTTPLYRDSRTGKEIKRVRNHVAKKDHYRDKTSGREMTFDEYYGLPYEERVKLNIEYVKRSYKPYVEHYADKLRSKRIYRSNNTMLLETGESEEFDTTSW